MNWKSVITVVAAVAMGLGTAKVGREVLKSRASGTTVVATKTAPAVVASHDLEPGTIISAADLRMIEMTPESRPDGAFASAKDLEGRACAGPIVKGQAMFEQLLAPKGAEGGLPALVPAGMRAITVEVSESSGVAGLLFPGCHVDVIATLRRNDQTIARTIVENVRVTAVGRKMGKENSNTSAMDDKQALRNVTLVVTPADAEAIELASTSGRPRLVLRGSSDSQIAQTNGVTMKGLLGESDEPAAQTAAAFIAPAAAPVAVAPPPQPSVKIAEAVPGSTPRKGMMIIRRGVESTTYFDGAEDAQKPVVGPVSSLFDNRKGL